MSINGNICPVFPTELGFICGGEVWRGFGRRVSGTTTSNAQVSISLRTKWGKKMNQRLLDHKFSQLALLDQQFYLVNQLVG